ncbi:YIF1-domain-containing protein [Lentinula detonsa]|uniref:Protein YIF1 n=1 Tax=Lentinula detonsa TaxID=2804962 RepID=A0AA38UP81_9AGAR|nr:YIF1-domain-containing protein [Lentinula detonsa]
MSSPPPLRHPVPTHPAYIPEPPSTPGSPNGYHIYHTTKIHQQQQHSLHPPHHPHQPSFLPQPDFAAWGFRMQLGSSAVAVGQEYVQKKFGGIIPLSNIKHHFNVSNSYVIHKLQLVAFPWTHKPWSRHVHRSEQGQAEYQDPREHINSPDLYIPRPYMVFVTYILISAFHSDLQSRFHPKILGESASLALAVVIVDFLFVYVGCYLLNVQASKQAVDIIAYSGYKFIGYVYVLCSTNFCIIFFHFFFTNGLILLRSLRSLVLPDPVLNSSTATISPGLRWRWISFLLFEAVYQFIYMLFLVQV